MNYLSPKNFFSKFFLHSQLDTKTTIIVRGGGLYWLYGLRWIVIPMEIFNNEKMLLGSDNK